MEIDTTCVAVLDTTTIDEDPCVFSFGLTSS